MSCTGSQGLSYSLQINFIIKYKFFCLSCRLPTLMPRTEVSEVQFWAILSQSKHSFSHEVFPCAEWKLKWVLHYISLHYLCSWISLNYILQKMQKKLKQAAKNLFIPVDCWLMMQSTRKPGCVCVSQNRAARAWGEQLRDKYVKPEKKAGRQRWQRWNIWPPVLIGQELQCNST